MRLNKCKVLVPEEIEQKRPVFEEAIKDTELLIDVLAEMLDNVGEVTACRRLLVPDGIVAIRHGLPEETTREAVKSVIDVMKFDLSYLTVGADMGIRHVVSPWKLSSTYSVDLQATCGVVIFDLVGDVTEHCSVATGEVSRLLPSCLYNRDIVAVRVEKELSVDDVRQVLYVLLMAHPWSPALNARLGVLLCAPVFYRKWLQTGNAEEALRQYINQVRQLQDTVWYSIPAVHLDSEYVSYLYYTPPPILTGPDLASRFLTTLINCLVSARREHGGVRKG